MSQGLRVAVSLAALGLGVAVLSADPAMSSEQALRALRGLAGAGLWGLGAVALGGVLLGECGAVAALALGVGVLGLLLLPVAALGLLAPPMLVGVLVALLCLWLLRPAVRWPELDGAALAVGALLAGPLLIGALAPPTDTDEIYQHLALPAQLLRTGGLVGGLLHPDGSRPMGLHLVYAAVMAVGGEPAPKLLHLGLGLACVLHTRTLGRAWLGSAAGDLAALLLLGSFSVVRELPLAHNNLPTALCALLALEAAREQRLGRVSAFAGLALATKYLAAPAVAGVMLAALAGQGRAGIGRAGLGRLVLCGLGALAWVAPWWLRNALEGLHPLFPYAGWPDADNFTFAYIERYGVGRDPLDLLLLPWNLTVLAQTDTYQFLGRVSPAGLALLPAAALAAWREPGVRAVALAGAVAFVGWAAGPHWLRYLLPMAPLVALALGAGAQALTGWGRAGVLALWVVGLPANWGAVLADAAAQAPVVLGRAPREALLAERVHGWEAVDWVNRYAPLDARVALLFAWPGYYLERPYILGSVEDHVPSRHLLLTQQDQALGLLRELGVTHVLAGKVRFLRKSYPFLDDTTFEAQFSAPGARLDELLLREGVVVYESGRFGVWRLPPP